MQGCGLRQRVFLVREGNAGGRPKSFDQFRRLAQAIAHEKTTDDQGNLITVADAILRSWAKSKEPTLQKAFIECAFGKVPDKLETNPLENKTTLILHYAHERQERDRNQRLSSGLS